MILAIYGSRQEKKQIPKNTDFYLADKREKVVSIICKYIGFSKRLRPLTELLQLLGMQIILE